MFIIKDDKIISILHIHTPKTHIKILYVREAYQNNAFKMSHNILIWLKANVYWVFRYTIHACVQIYVYDFI